MHKKFLRTSSKLLAFGMLCLVMNTTVRGMDSDLDPYWKGGVRGGSKYHAGMKQKAKEAYNKTWPEVEEMQLKPYSPYPSDSSLGPLGDVVCSCCGEFTLKTMRKIFYENYFRNKMTIECNDPYGESKYYRWKWVPKE